MFFPLLVALGVACHPESDDGDTAPAAPVVIPGLDLGDLSGKNLVYVHVDTLRVDHLPLYGYARDTLPNLRQRDWLVVDGLHAGSSWTMPSTGALLSANPPDVNGLTDSDEVGDGSVYKLRVSTVTEHLHALGWATGMFTGNVWLTHMTDLHRGFDVATCVPKDTERYNLDTLLDQAIPWVESVPTDQRFLLFLQPMNMHLPYWVDPKDRGHWGEGEPPFDLEEHDAHTQTGQITAAIEADPVGATQAVNDVYDEELVGLDRDITRLLTWLEDTGRLDDTVVVFSADHGEMLNDSGDGNLGHGNELLEELTALPLLVLAPGQPGGEATCVAENRDVFPTLLDAMGLPAMEGASGTSLREACRATTVSQLWDDSTHLGLVSASDGRERLERLCADGTELGYDLLDDPLQVAPIRAGQLTDGAGKHDALDEAVTRIEASWSEVECSGERDR